ncbi:hypothetical protein Poli38472_001423 [Pythium oligandrum]|uniref:NTF2 domain-containing protein n=1 Tax=Pythium oligandrum TaxID=41045 RepID=A0A8K1CUT6_PYTOL|nr:hypothetical protein Poli38472_001423 [Pythium oligandrum]|eukprot:TMW69267.1 hypothetical protein Poli38472_001423 [Pythium oligandrum]
MSAQEIADAFVKHYYTTFDTNRAMLANLYQPVSSMSWEGTLLSGQQAIMEKLSQLPTVRHQTSSLDIQPSTSNSAMLIFVQGKLAIDESPPIQFTQVFQLVAHQQGAYYIHNDIFRLQYAAEQARPAHLSSHQSTHCIMASITKDAGSVSPSRMTLMERQAFEKGDVSMLAQLRIVELDKLVARVKQRQRICLDTIQHYEREVGHIDKEAHNIMERYNPMIKRLDQRRAERAKLQAQFDDVAKQFGAILSTTKQQLRKSSHEHVRHIRDEANAELSGARGYPIGRESTVYQKNSPHKRN